MADQTALPGTVPAAQLVVPQPQPAQFDWNSVPKDALENKVAEIRHQQHDIAYNSALGRVVGESKADSLEHLKQLVEAGRVALTTKDKPKPTEPNAEAIQLAAERDKVTAELTKVNTEYSQKVMKSELHNAFLTAGGRANSTESPIADQAVMLMVSEGIFEVDPAFNLKTKSGITIPQAVDLWIKRNPHFAKAAALPAGPQPPGQGTPPTNVGQSNAMAAISQWLGS